VLLTQVSVLRISATEAVELCVDAHGGGSSVRLVAPHVAIDELGNMSHEEANSLFSVPGK